MTLTRRIIHDCKQPAIDERSDVEYRWTCPSCETQWEFIRSFILRKERRGLLRRVVRTWYEGDWFCIHRPEVWEPADDS